jgi:hypothetical protein
MVDLDALAIKYGSDKSTKHNGYTPYYEKEFGPIRESITSIMEIGVYKGWSMRMWKDYFTNAKVIGIDNLQEIPVLQAMEEMKKEGFQFFVGDQADPTFLCSVAAQIGHQLDIIVDDGGHKMSQQLVSFLNLWPVIRPGGAYVIEDLFTSFHGEFKDQEPTMIEVLKALIDDINSHGFNYNGFLFTSKDRKIPPTIYEETIESMTFYKAITFIRKKKCPSV